MHPLTTWSLRWRLGAATIAFALAVATVVALSVIALLAVRSQQRQVVDRSYRAVTLGNGRFIDQLNAETAVRGFALTRDRVTLQPYTSLQSPGYDADEATVRKLIAGDRASLAGLDEWNAATQRWLTTWAQPVIQRIESSPKAGLPTAEVLHGKALFDHVRATYRRFSDDLIAKRVAATRRLSTLTTLLFAAVAFAVVSVLAASIALWLALRRWVLDPLSDLAAQTRLVQGGDLQHVVELKGPRELASVATDVDGMRSELVAQLAQVERARLELEMTGQALAERADELARSNRDLEQFAYVASHDLQEPLRKIASFCQLLEQRYKGQLDERADSYIDFAVDGAKRMQQLINDLLAFSRVGRAQGTFVDVDLDGCLDRALANLSDAIAEAGAVIDREPLPTVPGDPGLLTQLFQNLIGNSLKFRGAEPPRITMTAARRDAVWEMCCRDNGIGIDPQYAERIFVIFQRLHGKDEYAGTGIGLALCKRIVEHHGGTIWLDPTPAAGTTFRWTLPVVAPARISPQHITVPLQMEAS
ncbi:MAG TPA: ATP-binding protein [Mycobacteriales bacterium]|nr:ATP-binding protein [Mycobacteriales bacterium]